MRQIRRLCLWLCPSASRRTSWRPHWRPASGSSARTACRKPRPTGPRVANELHLIGPLQTNKADEAVALFDVIETVDRPKLARALAKSIGKLGRTPRLLIQVNTGEEPQKAGVAPDELADLLALAREECGLEISGLMCIPPAEEPAAPHFALLKRLAARHGLATVSMGMSGDFELAARLGATHVRVGTGFFGARVEG